MKVGQPLRTRVAGGHGQHFLVRDPAVHQVKETDWARFHQAAGEDRNGHEDQHVERITVVAQREGEKPVVNGILDRAV
jgi:hypothetical protein